MLQQHNRNSGVKLLNCYSHAKFEKFLPAIYRDIHHLINVIYYSSVDDVINLNISKTKQDIDKLKTPLRLVWKCCSVVFKIGTKIFSLQWHFKKRSYYEKVCLPLLFSLKNNQVIFLQLYFFLKMKNFTFGCAMMLFFVYIHVHVINL